MTITVCPVVLKGTGKCRDAQCHLRHDVVHCKPCKRLVLHGELATHRRGEDHRLKCGFGKWKADARRSARTILPLRHPYVPEPKPLKKRARGKVRKEELAAGRVPASGGEVEARDLSVSGEDGLDFKSEVGVDIKKKKTRTIPVVVQKTKTADNVSLTLVDVVVTGAGSKGFSAITSLPMKIKGTRSQTVHISFAPTEPGEWDARLVLRFLHVSLGKRVILEITRRLHGIGVARATSRATSPWMGGDIPLFTPGVRASQKHPGSNKRGTRQRHDTGRDSPRSY